MKLRQRLASLRRPRHLRNFFANFGGKLLESLAHAAGRSLTKTTAARNMRRLCMEGLATNYYSRRCPTLI